MFFHFQRRFFAFFLMITLCFSGCTPRKTKNVQQDFHNYTKQVFRDMASSDTLTLHYTLQDPEDFGISKKAVSLGSFHSSSLVTTRKRLTKYFTELNTFAYDRLTFSEQETYDTLKDYLKTQLELMNTPYVSSILSPTLGVQSQLPVSLCEYTFSNRKDIETYLSLLSKIPSYFDSILSYEKEQLKRGYFMSDSTLHKVVKQIHRFLKNKKHHMLITSFSTRVNKTSFLSKKACNSYEKRNQTLVFEKVFPAFESLSHQLERYEGLGSSQTGLASRTNGKVHYEALVSSLTGTKDSVSRIIKRTDADLRNTKHTVTALSKKDAAGVHAYEKLTNSSIEQVAPKKILSNLKSKIASEYPSGPSSRIRIRYVARSMEKTSSPAFYMIPTMDSYKDNTIYINRSYFKEPLQLYSTLAHEGYPGHLYQTTYFYHKKKDWIRYILNFPGYCEGWATYVENESYSFLNFGSHSKTIQTLLSFSNRFSLALSSRIDLGVNYQGWNLKQVYDLLATYHIRDKSSSKRIYQEVIENPGNYLSYYVGFLEFQRLRVYYKKVAGKAYSKKAFHTFVLDIGPTSFGVLEQYIKKQKH